MQVTCVSCTVHLQLAALRGVVYSSAATSSRNTHYNCMYPNTQCVNQVFVRLKYQYISVNNQPLTVLPQLSPMRSKQSNNMNMWHSAWAPGSLVNGSISQEGVKEHRVEIFLISLSIRKRLDASCASQKHCQHVIIDLQRASGFSFYTFQSEFFPALSLVYRVKDEYVHLPVTADCQTRVKKKTTYGRIAMSAVESFVKKGQECQLGMVY